MYYGTIAEGESYDVILAFNTWRGYLKFLSCKNYLCGKVQNKMYFFVIYLIISMPIYYLKDHLV